MDTIQKKILYVEDEPYFASALSKSLVAAGYTVALAKDGEEALAMVASERPDLILLDLLLPKLSGKEVLKRIKADPATRDIPVIVVSNLSAPQDQDEMKTLGARAFYVKALSLPSEIVKSVTDELRPR